MKNGFLAMALAITVTFPTAGYSQNRHRAVEIGLGGTAINHTRTMVSDFHLTKGGDYVFTLKEKLFYGGPDFSAALELSPWAYLDVKGTLGIVEYFDAGKTRRGFSVLAGPGLQFRPLVRSEWMQPYLRLGLNIYHKDFPTAWFGQFDGDITKEAVWKAEDAWNKGHTFDTDTFVPLSAGVGAVGWLGNRVGIRVEGNYLRTVGSKGANFAQGTVGLVFRMGGKDKRNRPEPQERIVERVVEREVVKEVPVETVREVVREVPCAKTIAELMDNVTFDFDKADLTPESLEVLDEVARIMGMFPEERFLISGYTDARGSESYNERLSLARAKVVHDALIERGVPAGRLCYRGFGKRSAMVPWNAGDDLRRGDRKVVIERVTWTPLWEYLKENE